MIAADVAEGATSGSYLRMHRGALRSARIRSAFSHRNPGKQGERCALRATSPPLSLVPPDPRQVTHRPVHRLVLAVDWSATVARSIARACGSVSLREPGSAQISCRPRVAGRRCGGLTGGVPWAATRRKVATRARRHSFIHFEGDETAGVGPLVEHRPREPDRATRRSHRRVWASSTRATSSTSCRSRRARGPAEVAGRLLASAPHHVHERHAERPATCGSRGAASDGQRRQ